MANDAVFTFSARAHAGEPASLPPLGTLAAIKYFFRTVGPGSHWRDRVSNGFWFLVATEGDSLLNLYERFRAHPTGRRILATRPPFLARLRDRATLGAAPAGSLANCYYHFLTDHGYQEAILDAEVNAMSLAAGETEDLRWFRRREGVMHDLRHLLTGYGPNRAGELCLICFRYAQTHHPGLPALMVLLALGECIRPVRLLRAMREAFRRGRAAPLLDLWEWEDTMAEPLSEHRKKLGLELPVHYQWPQVSDRDALTLRQVREVE
jgi:ubiquinone biosynthesis protein COQ4